MRWSVITGSYLAVLTDSVGRLHAAPMQQNGEPKAWFHAVEQVIAYVQQEFPQERIDQAWDA
jgi:hypothetical protein